MEITPIWTNSGKSKCSKSNIHTGLVPGWQPNITLVWCKKVPFYFEIRQKIGPQTPEACSKCSHSCKCYKGRKSSVRWLKIIRLQSDSQKTPVLVFLNSKWELLVPSIFPWVKKRTIVTVIEFSTPMHIGTCNTMIALTIESQQVGSKYCGRINLLGKWWACLQLWAGLKPKLGKKYHFSDLALSAYSVMTKAI